MLQVENLSFSYHKGRKEVLRDFSLSLEKGRVYGLLGKNGTGKSTLLYLMSGLLTPQAGKCDVSRRGCASQVACRVAGYVFGAGRV